MLVLPNFSEAGSVVIGLCLAFSVASCVTESGSQTVSQAAKHDKADSITTPQLATTTTMPAPPQAPAPQLDTTTYLKTGEYPIAGARPDQRPHGAPAITTQDKGDQWYQQALQGVTAPYPSSLSMLEDQGGWYTPFNVPGMPSRYDIRGWFQQ